MSNLINETFAMGRKSVAFGTAIVAIVPGHEGKKTKVTNIDVMCAGTAHTLTMMRALNRTTVVNAVASGDTTLLIAADPGVYTAKTTANNPIAASDYIALRRADGVWIYDTVASKTVNADGTVTVALTTASSLPAIAKGAPFCFYGVTTDTDPNTGLVHAQYLLTASTVNKLGDGVSVVVQSNQPNEPILLYDNNATATGAIERVAGYYA